MKDIAVKKDRNETIRLHYEAELKKYWKARKENDQSKAWLYLQRAHIFSQDFGFLHTAIHVEMIKYAFAERNWRELYGQLPRILLAGIGSLLGRAPKGNPGTSDYGIFKKHPLPDDLARVLEKRDLTQ